MTSTKEMAPLLPRSVRGASQGGIPTRFPLFIEPLSNISLNHPLQTSILEVETTSLDS